MLNEDDGVFIVVMVRRLKLGTKFTRLPLMFPPISLLCVLYCLRVTVTSIVHAGSSSRLLLRGLAIIDSVSSLES